MDTQEINSATENIKRRPLKNCLTFMKNGHKSILKQYSFRKERVIQQSQRFKKYFCKHAEIIIATIAVLLSAYTTYLARNEFIAGRRPYVYVTCRQVMKDGVSKMDVKTILIECLNAPAKITKQEICHLVIEKTEENKEEIIKNTPVQNTFIPYTIYPADTPRQQVTLLYDFEREIAENPEIFIEREVRIQYKELSSKREYWFEGRWRYNRQYKVWEMKHMNGN